MHGHMSLRKSLDYTGISRSIWCYRPRPREVALKSDVVDVVCWIGGRRPTYGTRRMTAQVSRESKKPVNRK